MGVQFQYELGQRVTIKRMPNVNAVVVGLAVFEQRSGKMVSVEWPFDGRLYSQWFGEDQVEPVVTP